MEEEFIATIKLVSGEEIVARVAYMPEEESCLIHEPMEVEAVSKTKRNCKETINHRTGKAK